MNYMYANHPESAANPFVDADTMHLPWAVKARGCSIWDLNGKDYIDGCSGAITANMGHGHQTIIRHLKEQLDSVSFTYRSQFSGESQYQLANKLVELNRQQLNKVYFVGSGSEAIESAIKLAVQYFYDLGETQRTRLVSLRPSYHGSTLGALGATSYHPLEAPFNKAILPALNIPSPDYYRHGESGTDAYDDALLKESREIIQSENASNIAAVIVEPIGGASTGARVLSERYLRGLRHLCDEIGALLIMDEVLTGVGRSGEWFGWQHHNIAPDIIALGKGLGSGYYPIGAIMCRDSIVDPVIASGGFMHGHTYAGNPLGCAVGNAVIEAMEKENILINVRSQGQKLKEYLQALQVRFPVIGDVRGEGLLLAIEFVQSRASKEPFPAEMQVAVQMTRYAKEAGLLVYPRRTLNGVHGDHVLIAPPLIVDDVTLSKLIERLEVALTATSRNITQPSAQIGSGRGKSSNVSPGSL